MPTIKSFCQYTPIEIESNLFCIDSHSKYIFYFHQIFRYYKLVIGLLVIFSMLLLQRIGKMQNTSYETHPPIKNVEEERSALSVSDFTSDIQTEVLNIPKLKLPSSKTMDALKSKSRYYNVLDAANIVANVYQVRVIQ